MIRHLNVLIVLCTIALAICVAGTLYFFVRGNFTYAAGVAVASVLFFALLVVLLKDRRVAHIMNEDDYDKEHEAF